MRRVEIDEMLGLVKDDFLLEAQPSRDWKKGKGWIVSLLSLAAASVVLVAVGIKDVTGPDIRLQETSRILDESEVTNAPAVDYSVYFQAGEGSVELSDSIKLGFSEEYVYDDIMNMPPFSFDISEYEKIESIVYYDENKEVCFVDVRLENKALEKSLFIEISENGREGRRGCLSAFWSGEGVERLGVMVYGHTNGDSMELDFRKGEQDYYLAASGLTMNEMGVVMDALITDGISSGEFDLNLGKKVWSEEKTITIEEAGREELFGRYVPMTEQVGNLTLLKKDCSYYRGYVGEEEVSRTLSICYEDGTGQYIWLYFMQGKPSAEYLNVIPYNELSYERAEAFCHPSVTGVGRYHQFFVDYGDFYVDVSAITEEEIFEEFISILCH